MVNSSLDDLAPEMQNRAKTLVERLEADGLPFVVFESRRSFSRTMGLFMQGRAHVGGVISIVDKTKIVSNARAGESPHNWGLAVDCVLDPKHEWFRGEPPPSGPWDDGARNPVVAHAWTKYGRLVESVGLVWGGKWRFRDLPHAEVPNWAGLRPKDWKGLALREVQAGR